MPSRRRKSAPLGIGVQIGAFCSVPSARCLLLGAFCPIRPNVLWALDFQFDQTDDAGTLKLLNIIDEFTPECRAIVVGRSTNADKLVATLDELAAERGACLAAHGRWPPRAHRLRSG